MTRFSTNIEFKNLLMTYPTVMSQAIDYLNLKYGSVETYVRVFCGLGRDEMEALRSRYLP